MYVCNYSCRLCKYVAYECMYVRMCVCFYESNMYVCTYVHTYVHTYVRTYVCKCEGEGCSRMGLLIHITQHLGRCFLRESPRREQVKAEVLQR